jgi:hypothetical protein
MFPLTLYRLIGKRVVFNEEGEWRIIKSRKNQFSELPISYSDANLFKQAVRNAESAVRN